MKHITRNTVLGYGFALCVAIAIAGCSKNEDATVATAPPTTPVAAAGAAKPTGGGMIAAPTATPAPSGVQTGNFAGGKK